jgi:hypothetical protein
MHFSPILALAFLGVATTVYCTPVQVASRETNLRFSPYTDIGCNADWTKTINEALRDVATLADAGYSLLDGGDGWKKNRGYVTRVQRVYLARILTSYTSYTHDFKEEDMERVKKAWGQCSLYEVRVR